MHVCFGSLTVIAWIFRRICLHLCPHFTITNMHVHNGTEPFSCKCVFSRLPLWHVLFVCLPNSAANWFCLIQKALGIGWAIETDVRSTQLMVLYHLCTVMIKKDATFCVNFTATALLTVSPHFHSLWMIQWQVNTTMTDERMCDRLSYCTMFWIWPGDLWDSSKRQVSTQSKGSRKCNGDIANRTTSNDKAIPRFFRVDGRVVSVQGEAWVIVFLLCRNKTTDIGLQWLYMTIGRRYCCWLSAKLVSTDWKEFDYWRSDTVTTSTCV